MLKILGRKTSSNVMKVLWLCDELGIAYDREDVGGPFGKNDQADYLAKNPNGYCGLAGTGACYRPEAEATSES